MNQPLAQITRSQISATQAVFTARTIEAGDEIICWGVEVNGAPTIRGAVSAKLVRDMGGDPLAMAAAAADKIARGIRFDVSR